MVRSEETHIGRQVTVREDYSVEDLRGEKGTITKRWGSPEYVALDVLLDDGRSVLLWHYDLDGIEDAS
jgi:hypothetical protein